MSAEYENVLRRLAQGLADSVKKYSSQGNRVSRGSGLTVDLNGIVAAHLCLCLCVCTCCVKVSILFLKDVAKDALGRLKMVESEVRLAVYCQYMKYFIILYVFIIICFFSAPAGIPEKETHWMRRE